MDNPLKHSKFALLLVALAAIVAALWFAPREWLFIERARAPEQHAGHTAGGPRYACPMFCVIMDELPADKRCPVCGMELQEVADEASLTRHEQAMVGLEAEPIALRSLEIAIRQVGEVDYDETLLASVTVRVRGFLEKVLVQEDWVAVQAGQELAQFYADELFGAQGEYLVAWRRAGRPARPEEVADEQARAALLATTTRLRHLGVDDREIAALRERGLPRRTIALRAPRAGVVIRRAAIEGAGVQPGQELYVLADLSRVWIQVEVFENELPFIARGQRVELRSAGAPGQVFEGRVAFVDPVIDRSRRTARVRIAAENPARGSGRRFQPGQRVDATIRARLGEGGRLVVPRADGSYDEEEIPPLLSVPREAVLRTGRRAIAFVLFEDVMVPDEQGALVPSRDYQLDPEHLPATVGYELVELRLGPRALEVGASPGHSYYPVLGVVPPPPKIDPFTGERHQTLALTRLPEGYLVVSRGNFLLDSQAQLAGKPSLLFPAGAEPAGGDPHAGH